MQRRLKSFKTVREHMCIYAGMSAHVNTVERDTWPRFVRSPYLKQVNVETIANTDLSLLPGMVMSSAHQEKVEKEPDPGTEAIALFSLTLPQTCVWKAAHTTRMSGF